MIIVARAACDSSPRWINDEENERTVTKGPQGGTRGSEKDGGSTSSLNPVNNPISCFKINCLQFICRAVRCRLHKRPSVRTIICGRLPLRPFYTRTITFPIKWICNALSSSSSRAESGTADEYFRPASFVIPRAIIWKKVDLCGTVHRRATTYCPHLCVNKKKTISAVRSCWLFRDTFIRAEL